MNTKRTAITLFTSFLLLLLTASISLGNELPEIFRGHVTLSQDEAACFEGYDAEKYPKLGVYYYPACCDLYDEKGEIYLAVPVQTEKGLRTQAVYQGYIMNNVYHPCVMPQWETMRSINPAQCVVKELPRRGYEWPLTVLDISPTDKQIKGFGTQSIMIGFTPSKETDDVLVFLSVVINGVAVHHYQGYVHDKHFSIGGVPNWAKGTAIVNTSNQCCLNERQIKEIITFLPN